MKPHKDRGVVIDLSDPPPGLKKNELSLNAKREHLAGKNIRGEQAEDILDQIYGCELK
jgi:hypothetical protein